MMLGFGVSAIGSGIINTVIDPKDTATLFVMLGISSVLSIISALLIKPLKEEKS
jgi:hypothetical protein